MSHYYTFTSFDSDEDGTITFSIEKRYFEGAMDIVSLGTFATMASNGDHLFTSNSPKIVIGTGNSTNHVSRGSVYVATKGTSINSIKSYGQEFIQQWKEKLQS